MKRKIVVTIIIFYLFYFVRAQIESTSKYLIAQPIADKTITFSTTDTGILKPIIWGLDLAWLSEENIRRGINYLGKERINIIRSSFTPTDSLVNGDLQQAELIVLNKRINIIKSWLGNDVKVVLNCDHPSVHQWYVGYPLRWVQLIDVTTRRHQEAGLTVITVSPFNEPDYGWGQGTLSDFYNIAVELRKNPRFNNIRISGGNTLNTDQALYWYNNLKNVIDEGNTHQLAGSFDNYANFYSSVRANGHHATNDELHNINDAMVGVEYGLQTGIWWGTTEHARAEFVKASSGRRLGYAEHRNNWTSAAVYRDPIGRLLAFGGTSERQAITTTYRFVCRDKDVYWDGYGPQREFILTLPGGTGYQKGQTNAERVINITFGDDIQPVINGQYIIVNRASRKVMEIAEGSLYAGANVQQNDYSGYRYQQWEVIPVDSRIGGDFSYFTIKSIHSGKALDVLNWSLDDGGNIIVWDDTKGTNQQWFLEYIEDGWFYIRSRFSAKCLEVANSSNLTGANIQQGTKNGNYNQQWRFIPINAKVEFNLPDPPKNLVAKSQSGSVRLDWMPSNSSDVVGYIILRADSFNGVYNTIARDIKITSFVDNSIIIPGKYYYKVIAIDSSLNRSIPSNEVMISPTYIKDIIMHLKFDGDIFDCTENLNHCASLGNILFEQGKVGTKCLSLNGTDAFLQLPYNILNFNEFTIMLWVYWRGGASWQRIFDFGNGENEYLYLTPRIRFAIKNNGPEQRVDGIALPINEWHHIAVTFSKSKVCIYIDGKIISMSNTITINPIDIKPVLNYIGRGQTSVPYFNGLIDDFRIYNFSMDSTHIEEIVREYSKINKNEKLSDELLIYPVPGNNKINIKWNFVNNDDMLILLIYDKNGKILIEKRIKNNSELDISNLSSGVYIIKLFHGNNSISKKFTINN